jgi:hypothetical protein
MNRLIKALLAVTLCLVVFAVPAVADPVVDENDSGAGSGDNETEANWENQNYPPPPPDYEGVWPPEWMIGTNGGGEPGVETDDTGWEEPLE